MKYEYLIKQIESYRKEIEQLSLNIWANPEGAYEEYKASEWCGQFLEKYGFHVEKGVGGLPTAIRASYGHGGPTIGLLAEYDALPGLSNVAGDRKEAISGQTHGHGCGHNLIAAACAGAAIAVKDYLEKSEISGTIVFYGCPAEEVLTGKVFMARSGLFKELDAALAFHPMESNMASLSGGSVASNMVEFQFKGRSAHAASNPYNGRSALDAVQLMNMGCEFLREHIRPDVKLHYMSTKSGDAPNIVPDDSSVLYSIRALKRSGVDEVYDRVVDIAKGAALMTGTSVEIDFRGGCHDVLRNEVMSYMSHDVMEHIPQEPWTEEEICMAEKFNRDFPEDMEQFIKGNSLPKETQIFSGVAPIVRYEGAGSSSTDVGDVSYIVPTGTFTTACQNLAAPGHHWQITACSGTSIGLKGMIYAAKVMAAGAFELMTDHNLLEMAKEEFRKQTGGAAYRCPIPDEVLVPLK